MDVVVHQVFFVELDLVWPAERLGFDVLKKVFAPFLLSLFLLHHRRFKERTGYSL